MLIESYVVELKEVKRCVAGLDASDFIIVSENVFALSERFKDSHDLLSNLTPNNHPEVLLLVNKEYAKNLLLNAEYFEFVKKSHDIKNLNGVTLHLAFANPDLLHELLKVAVSKVLDGIKIKAVNHEALLLAQGVQERKFKDDKAIFKKALSIYN